MERVDAVVVGAGHAGLAMSNLLCNGGVSHVVVERGRVAERWRSQRWDSFTLLTPNWATWLPNFRYDGPEKDGFMPRDEVVSYFERYARSFGAPVRENVEVLALSADRGSGYRLETAGGEIGAAAVVIATGPFQSPNRPTWSRELPSTIAQLHSSEYRNPDALSAGAVLVVGTGASGQQIVEDLLRAGREVFVCVGSNAYVPRRYRGHDFLWWLEHGGFYEKTATDVPREKRHGGVSNSLTGYGGGHDLHLRLLHSQGATLLGRATGVHEGKLRLGSGLADALAAGDRSFDEFVAWVEQRLDQFEDTFGDPEPRQSYPDPPAPPEELDLVARGIATIVWATGFRPDYARWVHLPVLDPDGYPVHDRGVTTFPGLYFLGMEWLHRARSPFIRGAEEDARHIMSLIASS